MVYLIQRHAQATLFKNVPGFKYILEDFENAPLLGLQGFWGSGELFIFRELGSTGNYLQGFGEQAHSFGDLGSPAKK